MFSIHTTDGDQVEMNDEEVATLIAYLHQMRREAKARE